MKIAIKHFTFLAILCCVTCTQSQKSFRNIYDAHCIDLFVNPLYLTKDPSNTLIYKPTVTHCLMISAFKSALEKEKRPQKSKEIKTALQKMKKMKNLFLESYKFALPGIQFSDVITHSQQMRLEEMNK